MSITNQTLLETAMDYAERGIPIFPCRLDSKAPACAHGHKDASKDPDQIRAWWIECPSYNIGLCPEDAGWCVIDIDPRHRGDESWERVTTELHDMVTTRTVITPSGGRHLYFHGSLPSTVGKLGPGLDTRGRGGYVLVPPSVIDGKEYKDLHA